MLLALLTIAVETVTFPSGALTLHGVMYRPEGKGPFPAVLYNHGSAPDNSAASEAIGPLFARRGWVFFMPHRRGQGLSKDAGSYIRERTSPADIVRQLETEQLDDQLAGLAWLRRLGFVDGERIALAGNSFGGIETLLGVERAPVCAAIDVSGGAQGWAQSPDLRRILLQAARNARAPVLFLQPENDYDLTPSRQLSAAMREAGKTAAVKIYPPFGNSPQEGHSFAYRGAGLWVEDAIDFVERHCGAAH